MWLSLCHLGVQLWPWVWKDTSPGLTSSVHTQLHQHRRLSSVAIRQLIMTTRVQRSSCPEAAPPPCYNFPNTETCKMMLTVIYAACTREGCCSTPWTCGHLLGSLGWKPVLFYEEQNHGAKLSEFKSLYCLSQLCSWVNFPLSLRLNFILYRLAIMIFTTF